ncbi:MAG: DUF2079 domain-containing protein [Candidatus Omnitrophota bacterium]
MKEKNGWLRIGGYRVAEVIFFLLIAFYFSGGLPFLPESWNAVFNTTPKIYRKLFVYVAAAAVILGLVLFEWARWDKEIGTRSFLIRVIETWESASMFWITGFFVLFGFWWTASGLLRHAALQTSFDMAIFTQAIWNTTQGDWFYSSIKGGICLLGDHFAPLLAVFALPYRAWPEPGLLLAIQAFAVASCVFPLARIVRKSGQSPSWAVLFCLAFVLSLPVRNAVRFDFHPEVAAMPFLFWTFVFLEERKTLQASFFLAIALMAKENIATIAFAFGLYATFFMSSPKPTSSVGDAECQARQRVFLNPVRLWGIGWMVFSVVYFFTIIHVLIPKLSGAPYAYLDGNFTSWLQAGWGPFIKHVLRPDTFEYLVKIYGPLAFSSIFAPAPFILSLPTLAQNILSRNEMTRSIFFQYTATLTPFVLISSVMALAKLRFFRRYAAYLILLTAVLMSGGSEVYPMRRQWISITPHTKQVRAVLRAIPSEFSLRTHEFYAPHAANRKELHIYENNHLKEGGSWKARHADYVVIDSALLKEHYASEKQILLKSGYGLSLEEDGLAIFRRMNAAIPSKKVAL